MNKTSLASFKATCHALQDYINKTVMSCNFGWELLNYMNPTVHIIYQSTYHKYNLPATTNNTHMIDQIRNFILIKLHLYICIQLGFWWLHRATSQKKKKFHIRAQQLIIAKDQDIMFKSSCYITRSSSVHIGENIN